MRCAAAFQHLRGADISALSRNLNKSDTAGRYNDQYRKVQVGMADAPALRTDFQTLQFQAALVEISRAGSADLNEALSRISALAADALEVARVSFWLFNDDHTELRCVHLYDRERNVHESGAILEVGKYPLYFQALEESRTIPAEDARTHPCTAEFAKGYLDVLNIYSMLDVPIRREGRVAGVLCNEHTGSPRLAF